MLTQEEIGYIIETKKNYFLSGALRDRKKRRMLLQSLLNTLDIYEDDLLEALKSDLGKSPFESFTTEVGLVKKEIKGMIRRLRFPEIRHYRNPGLINFFSVAWTEREPYGVVLVFSPWNYPLQLSLMPLVGALTAGNTVILKTSEYSPKVSSVIIKMIKESGLDEAVFVFSGESGLSEMLLKCRYDMIFFTGSPETGKKVMRAAAQHLTPVVLELGGKSPCLLLEDADLGLSAKRILWGKLINAGQTCVAPDYVLVPKRLMPILVSEFKKILKDFSADDYLQNPDYPHIVNLRQYERLRSYLGNTTGKIIGGKTNDETLSIAPAIICDPGMNEHLMQEEIFGPLLPVIGYENLETVLEGLKLKDKPLAFYLFTQDKALGEKIMHELSFGGGCINDTIMHLTADMPFGGAGKSGMGNYHEKWSLLTFTREKSILKKSIYLDLPLRYLPYPKNWKWIRKFF